MNKKRSWELIHGYFGVAVICRFKVALDSKLIKQLNELGTSRFEHLNLQEYGKGLQFYQKEKFPGADWPGIFFNIHGHMDDYDPGKFIIYADGTPDSPAFDESFDFIAFLFTDDCELDLKFNSWELEFYSEEVCCDCVPSNDVSLLLNLLDQNELKYGDEFITGTETGAWRHGEVIWGPDGNALFTANSYHRSKVRPIDGQTD